MVFDLCQKLGPRLASGPRAGQDPGYVLFPGASHGAMQWLGMKIALEPSASPRDAELYLTEGLGTDVVLRRTLFFIPFEIGPYFEMQ